MKPNLGLWTPVAVLCLLGSAVAPAAVGADDGKFAVAVGGGIVEPDGGGEIYLTGGFRFRIGGGGGGGDQDTEYDWRGKNPKRAEGGIQAYLEPEVGYWSRSDEGIDTTDLLVGINFLGVVPGSRADYFMGVGFGVHFLDTQWEADPDLDASESVLGGNLQVGLDLKFADHLSLFGAARFDLLDSDAYSDQFKIYGGLRFRF